MVGAAAYRRLQCSPSAHSSSSPDSPMPTLILYPLAIIGLPPSWSAPSWGSRYGAGSVDSERQMPTLYTLGVLAMIAIIGGAVAFFARDEW